MSRMAWSKWYNGNYSSSDYFLICFRHCFAPLASDPLSRGCSALSPWVDPNIHVAQSPPPQSQTPLCLGACLPLIALCYSKSWGPSVPMDPGPEYEGGFVCKAVMGPISTVCTFLCSFVLSCIVSDEISFLSESDLLTGRIIDKTILSTSTTKVATVFKLNCHSCRSYSLLLRFK